MAVRRYTALIYMLLFLCSYLYLAARYNLHTVEYTFEGNLTYDQFESLRKSTKGLVKKDTSAKELVCTVNYIGSYRGNRLIMTTGFDNMMEDTPLLKGNFLTGLGEKQAVIGDRAADRIFRSVEIVGQQIKILGQEYKIVGVIKNSGEIYISYEKALTAADWNKKKVKFVIDSDKYFDLYAELLAGRLETLGLEVQDTYVYRQGAYMYINLSILLLTGWLWRSTRAAVERIRAAGEALYRNYREVSRRESLFSFGKKKLREIVLLFKELLLAAIALFVGYSALRQIRVSGSLLPGNLFSPSSYIYALQMNLEQYISRLEAGISGIALCIYLINLLLCSSYVIWAVYMQGWKEKNNKIEANSL